MAEPREVAVGVETVVAGVQYWSISDDRIGGVISTAHAVDSAEGTVLVDPLPLAPSGIDRLGDVMSICLTSGSHQRSAWRYREELGARVYAPALSKELDEEPDGRYDEGDALPGGLKEIFTPGAGTTQHTFLLEGNQGVAFVPDLLMRPPDSKLGLVPAEFMHDPDEARRSVEKLLVLHFSVLCLSHGLPVLDDPQAAIRTAIG